MTEWIPCPACGTDTDPEAGTCEVCGYRLQTAPGGASQNKCARCGKPLGEGFEFCQICGLRVHSRLPRPNTASLKLVPRRPVEPTAAEAVKGLAGEPTEAPVAFSLPSPVQPQAPVEPPALEPEPVPNVSDAAWTPAPQPSESDPSREMAREPARDQPGPGDTQRLSARELAESGPSVVAQPAGGPSWSPPMARMSVESGRRPAGGAPLRIVLVKRDGSEGETVPLRGPIVIGRRQGDLQFPGDEFISPLHARLEPAQAGGVRLASLGARNGVFVRISRPEPVFPGDQFLVGHHLMRLENIPPQGREQEIDADGVRLFGTPMQPAWGRLVVLGVGGAEAEVHCLRTPQIVFGRELGDIIFPADPFVSWQHAQLAMDLRAEAMTVNLSDLRSANGTYLRIRGDVILQPGDMFRVGDQIFRVRMH
jgi:hypothetical protein